ncbi:MAG: MoxR family ATPase [Victivallales bacterium]|nr:MoxR family ATPase [Victivallales bacterium]MCF7888484.1 MoxR family ATPase [Victivallales bacterium]
MDKKRIKNKAEKIVKLSDNINRVFLGKEEVVEYTILTLLSGGHVLLEDVPGVGKTLLAKAVAGSISGKLKRVQFTADLLPTDITGVTIFNQSENIFEFRPGPIFTNILLGDEINRATPRTQSSLLEVMEEKQATIDGKIYKVDEPFFVIATQNPIELEGTYPLPFSQMDRFMSRIRIGYLKPEIEKNMLMEQKTVSPLDELKPIITLDELTDLQKEIKQIKIVEELLGYIISIVSKTRNTPGIEYGVSPRGALDLMRISQAKALMQNRDYVIPDDIKQSSALVLSHRIILRKGTRLSVSENNDIIKETVESIPVPT